MLKIWIPMAALAALTAFVPVEGRADTSQAATAPQHAASSAALVHSAAGPVIGSAVI